MTDTRAERIAESIKPLRVHPGRRVHLAQDFDPGYRSDLVKKKDEVELLETGITLLTDRRYREINDWERYLVDNGVAVVKLFLNLSKEEQRTRFLKRIDVPERNWKFSAADVRERARWDDYQRAFSDMLSATSTHHAHWYVVPADRKWFARICAAAVLAHTLIEIDPAYPTVPPDVLRNLAVAKRDLEAEAPEGAAPDPYAAAQDGHPRRSKKGKKGKKAKAHA